jgi:prophage regulatory protein
VSTSIKPPARLLRLSSIIGPDGPVCVGRSTWWAGVKSGRFPSPVKLGPKITAWRSEDIADLITSGTEVTAQNRQPTLPKRLNRGNVK